jgi:choline kinase
MADISPTAVILAAGISSRLGRYAARKPKTLLSIRGTSLLRRTLHALRRVGIRRVIIVTGYLSSMVEAEARSNAQGLDIRCVLNGRYASTGNNTSLFLALRAMKRGPFILLDSDILFDPALLRLLLRTPHPNALILRATSRLGAEEIKVELRDGGRVVGIGKEIPPARAAGESVGIEKFNADAAHILKKILQRRSAMNEFYEASFQELIDAGTPLHGVPAGDFPCMEIDTPSDLRRARRMATQYKL